MWQYFVENVKDGKKTTQCQLCNVSLGYFGGTTSMRNHLTYKHPSIKLSETKSSSSGSDAPGGTFRQASALAGRQVSLKDMKWSRPPLSTARSDQITQSLALMCALDARPLSIVEGAGFKNFIHTINPDYKLPGRTTIRKHLHKLYMDAKAEVLGQIKDKPISMTTDIWTSSALDGYTSVTGHFLDDDWHLCTKNLSTNALPFVHIVSTDFKILEENIACVVTENMLQIWMVSAEKGTHNLLCSYSSACSRGWA